MTLRDHRSAFERIEVLYRVLVDVSKRDLSVTLFGDRFALPVFVAPTAFHKLAHPDGEMATVRAAGKAGTLMTVSSLSNTRVEDITAVASQPLWFQLYINKDRGFTRELGARVERARCRALMQTVDTHEWAGGSETILLDGGVRRGLDVLKAIALGATAVQLAVPCYGAWRQTVSAA